MSTEWQPEHWSWLERKFEVLLKEMRLLDYKHNHQVEVDGRVYYVDFAFPTLNLAIEVDSKQWHGTAFAKSRDADRQDLLEGAGWRVIRFRSEEILRAPDRVKQKLRKVVGETANATLESLTPKVVSQDRKTI